MRAFVLLFVTVAIGCGAGLLTWTQSRSAAAGLLAGGAAFGGALKLLHDLVE